MSRSNNFSASIGFLNTKVEWGRVVFDYDEEGAT